jgi:peptide/nickel transport system substrate-binding protein
VIYSFKRLTSPELKAPLAWRAGNIKELRAPDPYTVEYELNEPFSDLLIQLTMFTTAIHNQESVEAARQGLRHQGDRRHRAVVFRELAAAHRNRAEAPRRLQMGAVDVPEQGPGEIREAQHQDRAEDSSRVAAMLGGQFDFTHQIPIAFIQQVKAAPNLNVQEALPNFQLMYYGYKTTRPMVADAACARR